MYQLFRSLAYIHSLGICHRDIKPQNLLLDSNTGILKLCDFGSAKILVPDEANVSYICSRYYRAPELIFGSTMYTVSIGWLFCLSGCGNPFLISPLLFLQTSGRPDVSWRNSCLDNRFSLARAESTSLSKSSRSSERRRESKSRT